jgi:hypothetical protein
MIGVEALGNRDLVAIPALPTASLVAAHQHDSLSVGIERKQHPHTLVES